jgi:hypothetical protein
MISSCFATYTKRAGLLTLLCAGLSCAEVDSDLDSVALQAEPAAQTAALARTDTPLGGGTRTTLVEGIKAAENLYIASDDRVYITGDEGIYLLLRNADASFRADKLASPAGCAFGGITEARGTLYANCYAFGDSFVYAAKLSERPQFKRIHTLRGILVANGLTADSAGRLYVGCSGQDQILRLTPGTDSLTIAKQEVWLKGSGLLTNGVKIFASTVYWTDSIYIKSARLQSDGQPGTTRTLAQRLTFFDDLFVDAQGVLVADWLGGALRTYGWLGIETDATTTAIAAPSAVVRAKGRAGFSTRALLLTEKDANRVALFEPR